MEGKPFDISAILPVGTQIPDGNLTLIKDSDGSITALFPSRISFIFSNVESTLAIAFDGPAEFKNRTKGLLGTWNDDPRDDFMAPDGSVLPANASPQQIHYDFGLKCEFSLVSFEIHSDDRQLIRIVNQLRSSHSCYSEMAIFFFLFPGQIKASESLFTYGAQESAATFMDLSYVPMFIDNITWANDSFRLQAERVCDNNINCLFDAAVTEDVSYGLTTRILEENNNQVNRELGKSILQILFRHFFQVSFVLRVTFSFFLPILKTKCLSEFCGR